MYCSQNKRKKYSQIRNQRRKKPITINAHELDEGSKNQWAFCRKKTN